MTSPTTVFEAGFSWIDGVLENETLVQCATRVAKRHDIEFYSMQSDGFNHETYVVTFRSPYRDRLVDLYASDEGGGYDEHQIDDEMIIEIKPPTAINPSGIVLLSSNEVGVLHTALSHALVNNREVRFSLRHGDALAYKIGGGMWSPPVGREGGS